MPDSPPLPSSRVYEIEIPNDDGLDMIIYLDEVKKAKVCQRSVRLEMEINADPSRTRTTLQRLPRTTHFAPRDLEQLIDILTVGLDDEQEMGYELLLKLCFASWEYQCKNEPLKSCTQVQHLREKWMAEYSAETIWTEPGSSANCEGRVIIALFLGWDDLLKEACNALIFDSLSQLDSSWNTLLNIDKVRKKKYDRTIKQVQHRLLHLNREDQRLVDEIAQRMETRGIHGILEEDTVSQSEDMGNITPAGVLRCVYEIISTLGNPRQARGYPVGARTPALAVLAIDMSELFRRRFSHAERRQGELRELKTKLDSDWKEMIERATYHETLRTKWDEEVANWQTH